MASLFERLGKGLGQGLQMAGQMGLEEQRMARIEKLRAGREAASTKTSQEFKTSERESSQDFEREMAKNKTKSARPDEVQGTPVVDEMTGKVRTTYKSGRMTEYDPETDTTRDLGQGKGALTDESKAEDKDWAEKMANREAGLFSGDTSDFPLFKSEEKAAEAAAQFRSNARKDGTLDEFDTEFAKQGWKYIQDLAGGTKMPEKDRPLTKRTKDKPKKDNKGLMRIFKDFEKTDYDGIANQIIADPKAPEALKQEARDFLKGAG